MVEPSTWYEEEPFPPPRWRQQEDLPDRETPPPSRHWERNRAVITIVDLPTGIDMEVVTEEIVAAIGGEVETSVVK